VGKSHREVREMLLAELELHGIEASAEQMDVYMYSIFKGLSSGDGDGGAPAEMPQSGLKRAGARALNNVIPQYEPSKRTRFLHPDYSKPAAEVVLEGRALSYLARAESSVSSEAGPGHARVDVWLSRDNGERTADQITVNGQTGRLGLLPVADARAFIVYLDHATASGFTLMVRGYLRHDADGTPHMYVYAPGGF
jgi:hypothetical protein